MTVGRSWKRAALVSAAIFALGLVASCGNDAPPLAKATRNTIRFHRVVGPLRPAHPQWFVVDQARLEAIKGMKPIGMCCTCTPPKVLEKKPVDLPADDPLRASGRALIVQTVIDTHGRIVKARIFQGVDAPAQRAAIIRSFRAWRLEPAHKRDGRPILVYYMLAIEVPRTAGAGI